MSEIHFSEEQLGNVQAIGQALFGGDPSDPRSWNYDRKLIRPAIRWWRIILFALLWGATSVGLFFLLSAFNLSSKSAIIICIAYALIVKFVHLKRILICLVQMYQRFAPDSIRKKCRFEPSCSQYMILSLKKYGLWKGLAKGIDRLKRCNTQDGGFDYP